MFIEWHSLLEVGVTFTVFASFWIFMGVSGMISLFALLSANVTSVSEMIVDELVQGTRPHRWHRLTFFMYSYEACCEI